MGGAAATGAGDPSTEEGTPGEKLTGAVMGTPDSPEELPAFVEFWGKKTGIFTGLSGGEEPTQPSELS